MRLTSPAPVVFVPAAAIAHIDSITFDLNQHVYTLSYRDVAATGQKTITGPCPGALITALEAHVKLAVENAEGWTPGASAIAIA